LCLNVLKTVALQPVFFPFTTNSLGDKVRFININPPGQLCMSFTLMRQKLLQINMDIICRSNADSCQLIHARKGKIHYRLVDKLFKFPLQDLGMLGVPVFQDPHGK